MRLFHNILELTDRRRELRQKATPQEKLLWEKLRNRKLGLRFKRQYSIGGYILDFYCAEKRLIVEIDGKIHKLKENMENDKIRDEYFEKLDYETLRISNEEVDENIDKVIEKIKLHLVKSSPQSRSWGDIRVRRPLSLARRGRAERG